MTESQQILGKTVADPANPASAQQGTAAAQANEKVGETPADKKQRILEEVKAKAAAKKEAGHKVEEIQKHSEPDVDTAKSHAAENKASIKAKADQEAIEALEDTEDDSDNSGDNGDRPTDINVHDSTHKARAEVEQNDVGALAEGVGATPRPLQQPYPTGMDSLTQDAHAKLSSLVASYPEDTPDEHVVFGYGVYKILVGDLRKLFGISENTSRPG